MTIPDVRRIVSEEANLCWPFLLVVCTDRIVTALKTLVAPDTQIFQHIAGCTFSIAREGGNESHLRTVHLCYTTDEAMPRPRGLDRCLDPLCRHRDRTISSSR